jgi:phosphatidylglycerophosphatase A
MHYDLLFSWTRQLSNSTLFNLATLGGLGRRLAAPGTWGSLIGLLVYAWVLCYLPPLSYVLVYGLCLFGAIGVCGEAARRSGQKDPSYLFLDEVVAMPLCFAGLAGGRACPSFLTLCVGFGLFRLLDIYKPGYIAKAESLPSGLGIVGDDVAAALSTCLILHALHLFHLLS